MAREDYELKKLYWNLVKCKVDGHNPIDSAMTQDIKDSKVQEMNNTQKLSKWIMEEILSKTQKSEQSKKKSKVLEPLLYANEYFFKNEKSSKEFMDIQKWSKVIRRKQVEIENSKILKK